MGNHHDDLARLASFFGGEEAISVVKAPARAGTTTDDVIATQANVRLNTARKVLYKLYDHALVTCQRSRDEKTGWFSYHWKLQPVFFFQAEDGIRDPLVTGVQTCALPI